MTTLNEKDRSSSELESHSLPLQYLQDYGTQLPAQNPGNRLRISSLIRDRLSEGSELTSPHPYLFTSTLTPPLSMINRLKRYQQKLLQAITKIPSELPCTEKENLDQSPSHKKAKLIPWLRDKGYNSLADKMEGRSGYPWDEFYIIDHPHLLEQLVTIVLLCEHKELAQADAKCIIDFSLYLSQIALSLRTTEKIFTQDEIIADAKQILGQFIYLLNGNPELALNAIKDNTIDKALEMIKSSFLSEMHIICEHLHSLYLSHCRTQLQDPDIAFHTHIPIEIAKALLTDIGTVNVGIIDSLSEIFLPSESFQVNHEANLSYTLSLLQHSPNLREQIETISNPTSTNSAAQEVIKASLGIDPAAPLKLYDGRLTALIAILSHLRQGADRSCFAVSLAIELLSSNLGYSLNDLGSIIEKGKLTRCIDSIEKDIPFIRRINDENLSKKIEFNRRGEIFVQSEAKGLLWEAPGLIATCHAIGIDDVQTALLDMIRTLPPLDEEENYKMEVKAVIAKLCEREHASQLAPPSLELLYRQACFAFSSQTSQPLLKVWGNAIANMAEAEEGSLIKGAVMQCILDALQLKLGQLHFRKSLLLKRFFSSIQMFLYDRVKLQYDPTTGNVDEKNSRAGTGGFILLNGDAPIEGEAPFRFFIRSLLVDTYSFLKANHLVESEEDIQQLDKVLAVLEAHIETDECMRYLIARYHPDNRPIISRLSKRDPLDYAHMQLLPWKTQKGNNSKALFKIFLESSNPIESEKFDITTAEEALKNVIEICKKMSPKDKELYLKNPNKLRPFCILGKHRLPLMAGNPTFIRAWNQQEPARAWIDLFIQEGDAIANSSSDEIIKESFMDQLESMLPAAYKSQMLQNISARINDVHSSRTIKEYRSIILQASLAGLTSKKDLETKVTEIVDTALYESLRPDLKARLEKSAIHFADTNWNKGIQDLHLCFLVNPGSGKLELWQAQANGMGLKALNQSDWLINRQWEFMSIPGELIPDDSTIIEAT